MVRTRGKREIRRASKKIFLREHSAPKHTMPIATASPCWSRQSAYSAPGANKRAVVRAVSFEEAKLRAGVFYRERSK